MMIKKLLFPLLFFSYLQANIHFSYQAKKALSWDDMIGLSLYVLQHCAYENDIIYYSIDELGSTFTIDITSELNDYIIYIDRSAKKIRIEFFDDNIEDVKLFKKSVDEYILNLDNSYQSSSIQYCDY